MPHCIVCDRPVDAWLPHPAIAQRSPFMAMVQAVGSDLSIYQCPNCGCNDRDRHLWLYMAAAGLPGRLAGSSVLHMAPERAVEPLIERCVPARYVRGDLFPSRPNQMKLDLEALPFEAGSFDLIVCNHVLEHVGRPEQALRELHRCLREGGLLIAQTPYAPMLKKTFELTEVPTPDFAAMFFGQNDHVRLFGDDIAAYFHAAGFDGRLVPHAELLHAFDAREWGCNGREPFFAFAKPQAWRAAA